MRLLVCSVAILLCLGCDRRTSVSEPSESLSAVQVPTAATMESGESMSESRPVPAGDLHAERNVIEFGVYLFGESGDRDLKATVELAARGFERSFNWTGRNSIAMRYGYARS